MECFAKSVLLKKENCYRAKKTVLARLTYQEFVPISMDFRWKV